MLQPGKHMVRVVNCSFTPAPDGRPQLAVTFEDDHGETATWWTTFGMLKDGSFSQAAFDFAANQLRALGWDADTEGYAFESLAVSANGESPILGREAELVVVEEVYEGKSRIKVKFINDPNDPRRGGVETMAPDTARAFCDRLRSALGKGAPAARPRPAAPKRPAPVPASAPAPAAPDQPPADFEIPFVFLIASLGATLASVMA